ncbi:hypothetical protein QQ008_13365 [Fulvivirgaceae bacterium BMA10]|uniref:NADH:ubiquinone oxidoreductase intermediate-associated protein 30 domain-containing protein n=1 Tax=Splendidivirga corallicola TaxID=3051826 RepID=A0ABT8KNS9_9BACT|nr:hypothetical protein [Fulvivirgaceae bacterium BMA10]
MKTIFLILILALAINSNAQLLIDDFSSGELSTTNFSETDTELFQSGRNIVGNNRELKVHIGNKEDGQNVQAAIKNNKLISSFGYNTSGVLKINYGRAPGGKKPLNLDASSYSDLRIEFEAKSSKSHFYVSLFTNNSRAVWNSHLIGREGSYLLKVPLSELKVVDDGFTLNDIDQIRFQFNSSSITGHNFAIKKIWFQ